MIQSPLCATIFYLSFIVIIANDFRANASEICSCTPLIYEWKLDLTRECKPVNITIGKDKGIKDMVCSVEIDQANRTADLTPVKVAAYHIIELNMDLTPLKSEAEFNVSLVDGDLISFASITAVNSTQYSGGFQVTLLGINSASQFSARGCLQNPIWSREGPNQARDTALGRSWAHGTRALPPQAKGSWAWNLCWPSQAPMGPHRQLV